MKNAALQNAERWTAAWSAGMSAFADMCTNALLDNNLEAAQRFARRYDQCRKRYWNAFAREMVHKHSETPSRIDWYGEGST